MTRKPAFGGAAGNVISTRDPSRRITPIPRSVTYATAPPSPVQRVPKGREVFALGVVRGRAEDPSGFAAQSTNAPAGVCWAYGCDPDGASHGAVGGLSACVLPTSTTSVTGL